MILFDEMKASCADPNCSFPAFNRLFSDFPRIRIVMRRVGFDAQGYPYLLYGSRFATHRIADTLVRCLDLACVNSIRHDIPAFTGQPVIALRDDRLAMFLYQNEATEKLKLAHCVDLECTSRNMITTIANGIPAAIDVDNDGNPIIIFSLEEQAGWSIARCYDLACSAPVVSSLDLTGRITDWTIAVNASNEPVLSFDNGDLTVLQCSDANCENASTRVIDKASVAADMELDDNGFPVLAFRKSGTIRLARCHDAECATLSVEIVDEATGRIPSLTLDALSHPVIAYSNDQVGTLKLAVCGNPSCLEFVGELPDPGTYNLRSVNTGRYLDADPDGSVGTSRVPKLDDRWDLDLVSANTSLPYTLANRKFETPIESTDWIPEDAGDGTFYLRRLSDASRNYLSTSGNGALFTTRNLSDRWEFIPVD
ncbi:MAG: hypothetical protein KTR32_35880 [Granulosicoccus sp.]|nr:hypothetical protein [Granulosicoccus sp.]